MNSDELFKKLTELFTSKLNYNGEFYELFLIEETHGKIIINFLNKQHCHYLLMNLKQEILDITGSGVEFGYLNLKTSPISLKAQVQEEPKQIIKPTEVKTKEKVELPTIKNKTLKQIEEFMFKEHERIWEEQKELMERFEEPLRESSVYIANWGKIEMITNLYFYFKEIKDYEEE